MAIENAAKQEIIPLGGFDYISNSVRLFCTFIGTTLLRKEFYRMISVR